MTRQNFPDKVRLAAFQRADGRCEGCTAKLFTGKFHYDHRIPDALGGEPTLDNCDVLCTACHSVKTTKSDVPAIAKVKRLKRTRAGIRKASSFPKPPAGFKFSWKTGRMEKMA